MNEDEARIAKAIYQSVQDFTAQSDRSLQASAFKVGFSDLGFCSERTKRMLAQQVPEPTVDYLPAFIGTAVGRDVEAAVEKHLWPDAIFQAEVTVRLVGDTGTYNLTGHPDIIVPSEGLVLDVKTSRGLSRAEKDGPNQQQKFQRNLYGKAAWIAGHFGDLPLEQVRVGNVWFDRAADDRYCHVQIEPYDEGTTEAATMWLDDVVYAYLHGEEARKEPPYQMCAKACGFFATCRALESGAEGLITDPEALGAVEQYTEGAALVKQGKRLQEQAKAALTGVEGSTGEFSVKWLQKGGRHVSYDVAPYEQLDIRKIK